MMRTVWVAVVFLVAIGGLLATRVVSASASLPDDMLTETTAALRGDADPVAGTLTKTDRLALAAPGADDTVAIPLQSATVRPVSVTHHRAASMTKRPTAHTVAAAQPKRIAPAQQAADQAKAAATACRQRDPIARLLASANLAPRCAG